VIPRTIAIDGPSASGKSTVGEMLAKRLNYLYFDTGVMYRAVTLAALQAGIDVDDEPAVCALAERVHIDVLAPTIQDGRQNTILLDGADVTLSLRSGAIDANVSAVSAYPRVRDAMVKHQRAVGERGLVVMTGRDIGTVVMPRADAKIYLTASVEERARRRHRENCARGDTAPFADVLRSIQRRDALDSGRATAPLRPAEDAVIVDTEHLDAEHVVEAILKRWM
jgi:cytidylate kinase